MGYFTTNRIYFMETVIGVDKVIESCSDYNNAICAWVA